MINNLIKYFKDKKVLILGFGREGESTYKLIRKYLQEQTIYIADKQIDFNKKYKFLEQDKNVIYISGEKHLEGLESYDVIIKSPGISFLKLDTSKYLHKIKSQLELLLEFFEVFTIGITGTKGKSTTSALIYNILKDQNIKCNLLGNIGTPVFDYIDTIQENEMLVLEMSSHQLEYMKLSTNIAILLNVYEEHLDHYESFEKYAEAKCNIFKNQKETDYFLYNNDSEILNKLATNTKAKTYKVSLKPSPSSDVYLKNDIIYIANKAIYNINEKRNLKGKYNLNNIMFALAVSQILKLDINSTIKSIREFETLEHRLELVGKYNDIFFYDNSIATVPIATIEAVEALEDVDTLIIGGVDRGVNYADFIKYLNESNINNIICMPQTGHDIAKELKDDKKYIVKDLKEAVEISKKVTQKEKICLLSPAAASYGFFKNFEERGNLYKQFVKKESSINGNRENKKS